MNGMTEADAKRMQTQMKTGNYSGMPQPKMKKGKGKNKGAFRY